MDRRAHRQRGQLSAPEAPSAVTGFTPVTVVPDHEPVAKTANLLRPPHRPVRSTIVPDPARLALQAEWLHLTRTELPALAAAHGWPVRFDHCFQRILLDHACGGRWYDHIAARPAYAHATDETLHRAIDLARAAIAEEVEMTVLNRQSLAWRGKG